MKKMNYYRHLPPIWQLKKLLLIMKLTTILVLVFSLQVSANVYAQTKKFDLSLKNISVKDVLKTIESQSDFRFFYNDELSDVNRIVSIDMQDMPVEMVLSNLFNDTKVSYRVLDNNLIVISPADLMNQQQQVTGKVTDATTSESLPGVTIQVKGTVTGAISQGDGTYRLSVPESGNTLIFSYVGYKTQEIAINGQSVINVVMEEEVTALQEIVVTGYSSERKKDIIGSVSVVNTEEMLSTPSGNITAQIEGRVAGISVSSDGSLGSASKVRVRGFGSFASSEPLYIIDGVPASDAINYFAADGTTVIAPKLGGAIDRLNPNDIESVQVLKDAVSSSVYGSRAASGVVIITTKQGKEGPVKVNLDAYYGTNYVSKSNFPDLLNAQEWGDLYWKSYENAGTVIGPTTNAIYGTGGNSCNS